MTIPVGRCKVNFKRSIQGDIDHEMKADDFDIGWSNNLQICQTKRLGLRFLPIFATKTISNQGWRYLKDIITREYPLVAFDCIWQSFEHYEHRS